MYTRENHRSEVFLPSHLAGRCRTLAAAVRMSLMTPEQVAESVRSAASQSPGAILWTGPSLSGGYAGLALMHLQAAGEEADEADRETSFQFLRAACLATRDEPLNYPGLFDGTTGLALAMSECVQLEPRFQSSLDSLHEQLADQVLRMAWPKVEGGVSDHHYDLVSGAAGILPYLSRIPNPSPRISAATEYALDYLVWLASAPSRKGMSNRWFIAPAHYFSADDLIGYPYGYLDTGMAHGIAGVVTALAAAWSAGVRRPGHREALELAAAWLVALGETRSGRPQMPRRVAVSVEGAERPDFAEPDATAWCYGSPGTATALLIAAEALQDLGMRVQACAVFERALTSGLDPQVASSPTMCHGLGGIVAMCQEFATAGSRTAAAALPRLVEDLLALSEPDTPSVFRDRPKSGGAVGDPGLLTGAAGVAMTLQSISGGVRSSWSQTLFSR